MPNKLLVVENLSVEYYRAHKVIRALNQVSLDLTEGEILGIVGESGCGKTTLGLSLLRLIPKYAGKITEGKILFAGKDILEIEEKGLHNLRGKKISMIFQDPFSSFNPVLTIGDQIAETIPSGSVEEKIIAVLEEVQIPRAKEILRSYPHQLSGGMLQRAMLAMAVVSSPQILVADEPTTALDVTIQKEILELLLRLQKELKLSIILITHNLGLINKIANRVLIMYAGSIVEEAATEEIFKNPLHPYTRALLNSIPPLKSRMSRLPSISGQVPELGGATLICEFLPRCSQAVESCQRVKPVLETVAENHRVRCWCCEK